MKQYVGFGFLLCLLLVCTSACPDGCKCSVYGVKCKGITTLPTNSFMDDDVTSLRIEDSVIEDINPFAFVNLSVSYLTIKNVSIENLHSKAFHNISVSHFDLHKFNASSFSTDAFMDIDVGFLKIYDGNIETIQPNAFRNASISHFDFYQNNIGVVETNAFNNMSISHCSLYSLNVITVKTGAFGENFTATHFKLYKSNISTLENYAFDFRRENVMFSSVYDSIINKFGCHALDAVQDTHSLSLGGTCVSPRSVDDVVDCPPGCWCNTPHIICQGLTEFPELKNTLSTILSINNSTFTIPSTGLSGLPNIHTITMADVHIVSIESCAFNNIVGGGIISLQNVIISSTQGGVFCDLDSTNFDLFRVSAPSFKPRTFYNVNTTFFRLAESAIDDIEQHAFEDVSVKIMNIYRINVSNIQSDAFENFTSSDMRLYNSSLTTIKSGAFNNMNVTKLNLFNNTITTIQTNAFTDNLTSENFKIYHSNIASIEDYAFNSTRVGYTALYSSNIGKVGCHSLDGMGTTLKLNISTTTCKDDINGAKSSFSPVDLFLILAFSLLTSYI